MSLCLCRSWLPPFDGNQPRTRGKFLPPAWLDILSFPLGQITPQLGTVSVENFLVKRELARSPLHLILLNGISFGMSTREECLRYPVECLQHAQKAQNTNDRARFLEMAQAWRELAEKAVVEEDPED